jgi:outer membrane protein assembly factor BamB
MNMKIPRTGTVLVLTAIAAMLAGCAGNKNIEPPADLTDFRATARVDRVWSANIGGAEPKLRLGLGLATAGNLVFAAGHDGDVVAMNLASGKRVWRTDTKLKLSAGPGAGEGLVVAGASHGDIVALDAATGAVKWKSHINSELLSAPFIDKQVVLLRAVDGRVAALRVSDGTLIWSAEQQVPRLTLRGTSEPLIAGDVAVAGFDNGRLMALSLKDGGTVWEVPVAPPAGRTELDRLVDIDAAIRAAERDIYAVTYHGKVVRIDLETGQVQWSRDMSSYSGLALDDDGLYVTSADGSVVKIGRRTGVELWKQDVLAHRRLSSPAVLGKLVAAADLKGYVHFFDATNGELAARLHPLGDRVSAPLLVSGDLLLIMDVEGRIAALRIAPAAEKG